MFGFEDILKIALGSLRIGALLLAMPVIIPESMPGPIKVIFPIALSVMLLPFQNAVPVEIWQKNGLLILVIARELGLGLLMGGAARLIFVAVTMSLEIAGIQMGFAMASVFDPQNNDQISVLSQLGMIMSTLLFFGANLHHDLFAALVRSYQLIPIGLPEWQMSFMKAHILSYFRTSFSLAVQLAFPVMVAMLIIHLVIGIISKTAPQMNLFFNAAFAVNVVSGLLLVALTFPQMLSYTQRLSREIASTGYSLW